MMVRVLCMAALIFSGCISIATHEAQMKRCREMSEQARGLEKDLTQERARSKELDRMLTDQQAEREALKNELSQVRGTYDELIHDLKDEISRGEVAVHETSDGLVITLDNRILFSSGRADLQAQGHRVLAQIAEVLVHVTGHEIQVQGHTDNARIAPLLAKRFPSNWELSAARAGSVLRYLQEKGKISPTSLVLQAYAEQRPVGDNSTVEGRRANRRVDIVLVAKK